MALAAAAGVVHALNLAAVWLTATRAQGQLADESMRLFTMARPGGLATWFTATAFLVVAGLAWLAGRDPRPGERPSRRAWRIAAGAALVLSVDVAAGLHERIGSRIQDLGAPGGAGRIAWLGVLAVAAAATVAGLRPHVAALGPRSRVLALAAAALLLAAGLIGEIEAFRPIGDPEYPAGAAMALATAQKGLEMAGVICLVAALAAHLARSGGAAVAIAAGAAEAARR